MSPGVMVAIKVVLALSSSCVIGLIVGRVLRRKEWRCTNCGGNAYTGHLSGGCRR